MRVEGWLFLGCGIFIGGADVVYWYTSYDPTGTTALALAVGLCLLTGFYIMFTGRRLPMRPEDDTEAEVSDGTGEIGFFSPHSWWPLFVGVVRRVHRARLRLRLVDGPDRLRGPGVHVDRLRLRVLPRSLRPLKNQRQRSLSRTDRGSTSVRSRFPGWGRGPRRCFTAHRPSDEPVRRREHAVRAPLAVRSRASGPALHAKTPSLQPANANPPQRPQPPDVFSTPSAPRPGVRQRARPTGPANRPGQPARPTGPANVPGQRARMRLWPARVSPNAHLAHRPSPPHVQAHLARRRTSPRGRRPPGYR